MQYSNILSGWPGELATTEHVQMQMIDRLTSLDAVVHDNPESIRSLLLPQHAADVHQVAH